MYGDKRDYPKIDIYRRKASNPRIFDYVGSSTWSRTCREAKDRYLANTGLERKDVKTCFAKH
jgi:hypothetical protein